MCGCKNFSPLLKSLANSALSKSYPFVDREDQLQAHRVEDEFLGHGDGVLSWMAKVSPLIGNVLKAKEQI